MTRSAKRNYASIIALATTWIAIPSIAYAQDDSSSAASEGEIVVTAQRREEVSRDVPITVTTLDQAKLDIANVKTLGDTVKLTPGLRFDSQGGAVQPTIRGVGTAVTTSGGGPNVGIYVDGFFQSNPYVADFQLMRVKNIQVLKGPQGTLFGRNTTGGAILVTTADPSTETGGEFRVSYGKRNELGLQGYATFGLAPNVAVDLEANYSSGDGHFTNVQNGDKKIGKRDAWSVRGGLKVDLSENASLLLRYTHSELSNPSSLLLNAFVDTQGEAGFFSQVSSAGKAIYGKANSVGQPLVYFYAPPSTYATAPGAVNLNAPLTLKNKSDVVQATLSADLGFADLTSYTQYRKDNTPNYADLDATALPLFNIFIGVNDASWGQEFLLNSKPGSPLQWTAGINYFQVRDTWDVDASFGNAPFFDFGGSSTTTKSYAAFLDMTYALSDKLFVTAGGRYSHDLVADSYFTTNPFTSSYTGPTGLPIAFTGLPGTQIPVPTLKNSSFTPRFVLRYKPGEDSSIYASYTKGYKAGILNVGGLSQLPVKPENINAFEVGYKYDDRVFSVDLSKRCRANSQCGIF
jgi:iron complex outermembrane recepter protein